MAWSGEHRAFAVEEQLKNESVITTQRAFRRHFGLGRHSRVPDGKTIRLWVSNFRATSSALKRLSPGRPRTATDADSVELVRASIQHSPRRSARKHAAALSMSDRSVRRILHDDLNMHPYKTMIVQELSPTDYGTRVTLCSDILREVPPTAILISSDEAHFHLSGMVNKQNFRYWTDTNPQELHQRPLHSPKVTVWCAMGNFGVWGPYFFEEDGELR